MNSPIRLQGKLTTFMVALKSIFGDDAITPKFHCMLHLPRMLQTHGILIPCFVHERKHRVVKRFASDIRNTSRDYERSLLAQITNLCKCACEDGTGSGARLLDPHTKPAQRTIEQI